MKRRSISLLVLMVVLAISGLGGLGFAGGGSQPALAVAPVAPVVPVDGTEPLPPGTSIQTVLPNMNFPIAMAFDPAGRLFYTEKTTGNVRLFANGVLQTNPVIAFSVNSSSERGLLGIAIDPNFNQNHFIYVYYTCAQGSAGCPVLENRVVRFVENNGVGSSPTTVFFSPQTAGNHNGGNIHFGADGKLYISVGDNADAANSQNVTVKNGKMHRINPDGSIPSDNPVFTQTGALGSLYALGLRNSFDFTFDSIVTNRIFASENGPGCDDEMNRVEAGWNYGWRAGYPCDDPNPSIQYNTIPPLWFLANGACCQAPTGIEVYTGNQIPQWQNHLFMATYNNSQLRHFYLSTDRTVVTTTNVVQGVSIGTDLETGPDGALWYIQGGGYTTGTLKMIVGLGGSQTPTVTRTPTGIPTSPPTGTSTVTPTSPPTFTPSRTPTPPCPLNTQDVAIQDFVFVPENITVTLGTTVRWTNFDLDYHTATSNNGAFDSGQINQNENWSFTFNTPGTYSYICTPHPYMVGTITVLSGCVSPTPTPFDQEKLIGHVVWQGRPAQPSTRQSLPITLTLRYNNTNLYFDFSATTDQYGFFTVTVGLLPNGNYAWRAKGPQYLASSGTFTLADSNVQVEMGTQTVGDANGDNCVSSADFTILKGTFGKAVGDPGYDPRADFTGDGAVNSGDFNLLKVNFGICGMPPIR